MCGGGGGSGQETLFSFFTPGWPAELKLFSQTFSLPLISPPPPTHPPTNQSGLAQGAPGDQEDVHV